MITFGIQLPHYGNTSTSIGIRAMADAIVQCGYDGIWLSDHVVLVDGARSRYPYTADGTYGFAPDVPWFEAVTTMAYLAAITTDVELGIAVCVLPQRQPVVLAKQMASIDQLCGGRVRLGVGTGWLAEEFAALGAAFDRRGASTDEGIALLRACWSGAPPPGPYGDVVLPSGVRCEPRPVNGVVPILVGGNTRQALRRAARLGDGWLGAVPLTGMSLTELGNRLAILRDECDRSGRDMSTMDVRLRVAPRSADLGSAALRDLLVGYVELGVRGFTVDIGWRDLETCRRRLNAMAATAEEVRQAVQGVPV